MKANYKKLWHILLDRNMKKKELAELADVSTYTINKLNKNENVTVEVLEKICEVLDCSLDDIMEFEDIISMLFILLINWCLLSIL
ncbi:helix-turn-helix domain-containing protein [Peptoanaerobacter stomatis]|uniref:helix-turn-helix domain-containing protein n=1 Tax=Peptoanaerobacter stomatis TaxID=796937 RepID=UPI003FA0DB34